MIWRLLDSIFAKIYTWTYLHIGYHRWLDRINAYLFRRAYASSHGRPKNGSKRRL
jgi:hypothetical protein